MRHSTSLATYCVLCWMHMSGVTGVGIERALMDNNEVGQQESDRIRGRYIVQFKEDASMDDIQTLVSQFGVSGGAYEHVGVDKCPGQDIRSADCEGFIRIGDNYKVIMLVMPTETRDGAVVVPHESEIEALRTESLVKNVEEDAPVHIADEDEEQLLEGDKPKNSAHRVKVGL